MDMVAPPPPSTADTDRTAVLGVGVSLVDIPAAVLRIQQWIRDGEPNYVCVTGVHGVMESQRDAELRRIHNDAGMVVPDGMPLVWIARRRGYRFVDRVYGPDLMLAFCAASERTGHRHFLYGGAEGVPELLRDRLVERFPALQVVGTWSPPFRPLTELEDREMVQRITDSGADVVWVGLSTPKQERWMSAHVGRIPAVLLGVGAAFDFHAGLKKQAPPWMQRAGMEWFYRMVSEPRRLGPRYLRNNPEFLLRMVAEKLRGDPDA